MICWKKITLSSFGTTHTRHVSTFPFFFLFLFPCFLLDPHAHLLFFFFLLFLLLFFLLCSTQTQRERDKRVRSRDGEGDQRERVESREMRPREPWDWEWDRESWGRWSLILHGSTPAMRVPADSTSGSTMVVPRTRFLAEPKSLDPRPVSRTPEPVRSDLSVV